MAVPPPPPPGGRIFASKGLCTSREGYPCARVTLASGLKIARIYEQFSREGLPHDSTLPGLQEYFVTHDQVRLLK